MLRKYRYDFNDNANKNLYFVSFEYQYTSDFNKSEVKPG